MTSTNHIGESHAQRSAVSYPPRNLRLEHCNIWDGECSDVNFLRLTEALRPYGGLLPLEEVRALCHVGNPGFGLTESVMRRDVFTLEWRRQTWVPCFQFMSTDWKLCQRVFSITAEMRPTIDGEDLALWFIEHSPWLRGSTPLSLVYSETERVRQAARIDRFAISH